MQSADKKRRHTTREIWRRATLAVVVASRRDLDVSQEDLANRMGCSRSLIANLESGRRKFELADVAAIAIGLDLKPETLFKRITDFARTL